MAPVRFNYNRLFALVRAYWTRTRAMNDCKPPHVDTGDRPKTVNIFLGFFFMLNLVVGTGFLGIPYAFYSAGLLAGAVTLIIVAFVSWNCAIWTLEVMARAQVSIAIGLPKGLLHSCCVCYSYTQVGVILTAFGHP